MDSKKLIIVLSILTIGVAIHPLFGHAQLFSLRTFVHDNGILCRPSDGANFASFSRSQRGIKNTSTSNKTVFCPITSPTYDSQVSSFPLLIESVRIYVNQGGVAPTCQLYAMSREGQVQRSGTGMLMMGDMFDPSRRFSSSSDPPGTPPLTVFLITQMEPSASATSALCLRSRKFTGHTHTFGSPRSKAVSESRSSQGGVGAFMFGHQARDPICKSLL
jgi:hypothetical protein